MHCLTYMGGGGRAKWPPLTKSQTLVWGQKFPLGPFTTIRTLITISIIICESQVRTESNLYPWRNATHPAWQSVTAQKATTIKTFKILTIPVRHNSNRTRDFKIKFFLTYNNFIYARVDPFIRRLSRAHRVLKQFFFFFNFPLTVIKMQISYGGVVLIIIPLFISV